MLRGSSCNSGKATHVRPTHVLPAVKDSDGISEDKGEPDNVVILRFWNDLVFRLALSRINPQAFFVDNEIFAILYSLVIQSYRQLV